MHISLYSDRPEHLEPCCSVCGPPASSFAITRRLVRNAESEQTGQPDGSGEAHSTASRVAFARILGAQVNRLCLENVKGILSLDLVFKVIPKMLSGIANRCKVWLVFQNMDTRLGSTRNKCSLYRTR